MGNCDARRTGNYASNAFPCAPRFLILSRARDRGFKKCRTHDTSAKDCAQCLASVSASHAVIIREFANTHADEFPCVRARAHCIRKYFFNYTKSQAAIIDISGSVSRSSNNAIVKSALRSIRIFLFSVLQAFLSFHFYAEFQTYREHIN